MKKNKKQDLLYDMENKYSPTQFYLESERRDVYYSALVKDIVKNNRTGQVLKCIFFAVVCIIFAFICVFGLLIILNISKKGHISYSDIGVAITGFGSVLGSIIVLPKIIANHLFPKNSEEVRFGFIKENQKLDQSYLEDDISDIVEEDEEYDVDTVNVDANSEDEDDVDAECADTENVDANSEDEQSAE